MKKKTAVVILVVLLAMIGTGIFLQRYTVQTSYREAGILVREGRYEEAMEKLEIANANRDFKEDLNDLISYGIEPLHDYYKDSLTVYAFALARQAYDTDKDIGKVKAYLALIPESYAGDLGEEIRMFRADTVAEIAAYDAEQARKAEEARMALEKAHQEFLASLKTKIPYEGMSEEYIDCTMMGKHHTYKNEVVGKGMRWETTVQKYYWENVDGDTILYVDCEDGVVKDVIKYGIGYFWTEDGKPNFNGKNPYTSSDYKSKKKAEEDDTYNVNDYYDPEDFYYDNYDDFWEYEEAGEYYYEHHRDYQ